MNETKTETMRQGALCPHEPDLDHLGSPGPRPTLWSEIGGDGVPEAEDRLREWVWTLTQRPLVDWSPHLVT
jgi:hypothetical protein